MKTTSRKNLFERVRVMRTSLFALVLFVATASGCAIQETNTYPVELFSEMHYAQSTRSQEPPRLAPAANAVPFHQIGAEQVLRVPEFEERPYDPAVAKELFRVNCSICHGTDGSGTGPVAAHITSSSSYYATANGEPYAGPANLKEKREAYEKEAMINLITNGVIVMPRFGKLLSAEEIRDVATYVYDKTTGLGP